MTTAGLLAVTLKIAVEPQWESERLVARETSAGAESSAPDMLHPEMS